VSPGVGVSGYLSLGSETLPSAVEKECRSRGSSTLPLVEAKEGLYAPVSLDRVSFWLLEEGACEPWGWREGSPQPWLGDPACLWPSKRSAVVVARTPYSGRSKRRPLHACELRSSYPRSLEEGASEPWGWRERLPQP